MVPYLDTFLKITALKIFFQKSINILKYLKIHFSVKSRFSRKIKVQLQMQLQISLVDETKQDKIVYQ